MRIPATQRSRLLAPGDKLGDHELIRRIAAGGTAELYLARTVGREGFEELCVVKRLLPQHAGEARLAATLHHPNLVQVFDVGQEAGDAFYAMEYVHGEDLGRLVAAAAQDGVPIALDVALTLLAGLCAGLHHAHEQAGVVHGDVSPSNVLVGYDGAVKLVDVGIPRRAGASSAYGSPEQGQGAGRVDRRSDVFSAGTLLYELTTSRLPSPTPAGSPVPPSAVVPGYPPALEAIVLRALARDPTARPATALELQRDLEDFARAQRLRVSPRALARLMSNLFPARLEEWKHARAQGAFFVEQHVVRTLIESGKTGDAPVAQISSDDETTGVIVLPPSGAGVARGSGTLTSLAPQRAGTLVTSTATAHDGVPERASSVGDVTELVRVRPRRKGGVILAVAGLAVVAAATAAIVIVASRDRAPAPQPAALDVPPPPPPAPIEPAPEPVVAEVRPDVVHELVHELDPRKAVKKPVAVRRPAVMRAPPKKVPPPKK
ncbi:MAG: serine/threonine protein kinase [Deltaproteobacteria bacterium]|nr:serine/threonine protein kinase [Deltaproteobacteria bacterium]